MNVTAWMNMPSPYQSRFFAALAQQPGVRVRLVYAYGISEDRAALGWKRVDEDATYEIVMLKSPGWLHALWLGWKRRHDFQMVNSLWAVPVFAPVRLLHCFAGRNPMLIHSEASDPTLKRPGWKTSLRDTIARSVAATRRFGVLAISPLAERQYHGLGFDEDRIYSFGYFNAPTAEPVSADAPFGRRIVFVGQLIPRKGWQLLFEAMRDLWTQFPDLTLDVIGAGPDEQAMRTWGEGEVDARVRFLGPISADRVSEAVRQYDLLVLPSSFDGWGLVVNEALMVGVPVVASTACGAACLVEDGRNGFTAKAGDPSALGRVLENFLSLDGPARARLREGARTSAEGVSLPTVAAYFVDCFRHAAGLTSVKPTAPWMAERPGR